MHDSSRAGARDRDRIQREAREWLILLESGRATAADGDAFREWCARSAEHARAFSHCRRVWSGMGEAARSRPDNVTRLEERQRPGLSRRAFLGGAAAACAGWVVMRSPLDLWPGAEVLTADLWTATGEQREVVLPDTATVQLNTRTRVDLQRRDGAVTGLVLRGGETEVTTLPYTPARFTVSAGNGHVEARGARFNVRYTDDRVRVTCLMGEITVAHGRDRSRLRPAQQVVYNETRLTGVTAVDPQRVSAWRQRILVFDGTPLASVVEEVNRYRPGRILLLDEALGRTPVQAYLSLDRLEDFAALVREVRGATVRDLPGGVLIIS
ncbi:FecR family protein [Alloalcanivorax sp. C16-2]|uniref:FecR family protein n=1 Tax=Alloalcanivorax TaxID=3020832 RepID=UPI0019319C5D|nr:FecR domain-containing protein [Alloalcanivorax marinus]MBL7252530.1 FecR domain-containing protein [Alloalcanivorax marinus]